MNERNTMTVKEAAKILEVGTQKIRTGIISGKLPIGTAIFEEERAKKECRYTPTDTARRTV